MQTIPYLSKTPRPWRFGLLSWLILRTFLLTAILVLTFCTATYALHLRYRFPGFLTFNTSFANIDSVYNIRWYGGSHGWDKHVYFPSASPAEKISSFPDEAWQRALGAAAAEAPLPDEWSDPHSQTNFDFDDFSPTLESLSAPKTNDVTAFTGIIIHGHDAAGRELMYLSGNRVPRPWGEYVDTVISRENAQAPWTIAGSQRFTIGKRAEVFWDPIFWAMLSAPMLLVLNLALFPLALTHWKRRRRASPSAPPEIRLGSS